MKEEERAVADAAYAALVAQDWPRFRLLLHPYLHWTGEEGVTVRGRVKVLDMLAAGTVPPDAPVSVELRDGQVYRWRSA